MSVRTVVVDSLSELIAQVTPSDPDPATGRRRSKVVYRGASDASWPLYTSLDTLGGVNPRIQRPTWRSTSSGTSSATPDLTWERARWTSGRSWYRPSITA